MQKPETETEREREREWGRDRDRDRERDETNRKLLGVVFWVVSSKGRFSVPGDYALKMTLICVISQVTPLNFERKNVRWPCIHNVRLVLESGSRICLASEPWDFTLLCWLLWRVMTFICHYLATKVFFFRYRMGVGDYEAAWRLIIICIVVLHPNLLPWMNSTYAGLWFNEQGGPLTTEDGMEHTTKQVRYIVHVCTQ